MGTDPDHIIEEAGFELESDSLSDGTTKQQTVKGSASKLIYDYVFNSREGGDRTPSVKVAEVLVQLIPQVLQVPGIIEAMGIEKIYELINAIMRNAGAGVEFKLSAMAEEGQAQANQAAAMSEEQAKVDEGTMMAALDQISALLGQLGGKVQDQEAEIGELKAVAEALLGGDDRREQGQRFEGGPISDVPTQGNRSDLPILPNQELPQLNETNPLEAQALQDPFETQ